MPKNRSDSLISERDAELGIDEPELVQLEQRDFEEKDQVKLSLNEHFRFMPASKKVGHALVYQTDHGLFAKQFTPPSEKFADNVTYRPLKNIQMQSATYGAFKKDYIRATTPNGTQMLGKRKIQIISSEFDEEQSYEMWRLSPEVIWKEGKPFIGCCDDNLPIFTDQLSAIAKEDLDAELQELGAQRKHQTWEIDNQSVLERERRAKEPRVPSQNDLMGHSAFVEYEMLLEQHGDELHPERVDIIKNSTKYKTKKEMKEAPKYMLMQRPEWLHLMGHGLTKWGEDPQFKGNLAAAPQWVNTTMLDAERAAKWFALHRHQTVKISAEVLFNLIPGTDVINRAETKFTFAEGIRSVTLQQKLNPWVKYSDLPKPTDICQTTMVTYHLMVGTAPASILPVKHTEGIKIMPKKETEDKLLPNATKTSSNTTSTKTIHTKTSENGLSICIPPVPELHEVANSSSKSDLTKTYKQSVVRVECSSRKPEYSQPWRSVGLQDGSGTGFVIKVNSKLYIVTNEHVVRNHLDTDGVDVRLAFNDEVYNATVIQKGTQCDLALLEVTDTKFLAQVVPFSLGDMAQIEQKLTVIGFPLGDDELSTTTGIASRYAMGLTGLGESMLKLQSDVAINSGNSGGPVLSKGKVVGVAFQNCAAEGIEGMNFVIPVIVLKQFLQKAFDPTGYKGFPVFCVDTQDMNNPGIREYFGLTPEQTGIRVNKIDKLSAANGVLQIDDIITHVDGVQVSNDAKVNVPGVADRIDVDYLFLSKNLGDIVKVSILRRNPETKKQEPKIVDIRLAEVTGSTKKIGPVETDKLPTYYFNSGVLFQPLTENYISSASGKDFAERLALDGGGLEDVAKENPDDQIVIINTILKCKSTRGIHTDSNLIVKEINGIQINNIYDVIRAMENTDSKLHAIRLNTNELIAIDNMSPEEQFKLLKKCDIKDDRSDDLKGYVPTPIMQVEVPTEATKVAAPKPKTVAKLPPPLPPQTSMKSAIENLQSALLASDESEDDELDEDGSTVDSDDFDEEEEERLGKDFIVDDEEDDEEVDPEALLKQIRAIAKIEKKDKSAPVSAGDKLWSASVDDIKKRAYGDVLYKAQLKRQHAVSTDGTELPAHPVDSGEEVKPKLKRRLIVQDSDSEEELQDAQVAPDQTGVKMRMES